jgi:RNA polymerase sporulation-specific sigma factor
MTDLELLQRSRNGEEAAGDALILRYGKVVRSCIRPYFLAGGDSEDLLQEGMIGFLSAMREYHTDGGASFRTYAELCIRRRIISAAKSASRLKHSPLNDGISLEEILSEENNSLSHLSGPRFDRSPEDQVLAREREGDVLTVYSRYLSRFETEILSQYLNGESYDEIAAHCGRSRKSVDNAVQRIRKKLARHLTLGDFS